MLTKCSGISARDVTGGNNKNFSIEENLRISAMAGLTKNFHIKSRDFIRAGEASISVQNLLKSLNYDPKLIRRIAICGYEGEMNVVMHGGDGFLKVEIDTDKLIMEISDSGPGIEDIELAMQAGYSTANDDHREMGFGAGMGLPNIKKNSDQLNIESEKGSGTRVRMVFYTTKSIDS